MKGGEFEISKKLCQAFYTEEMITQYKISRSFDISTNAIHSASHAIQ